MDILDKDFGEDTRTFCFRGEEFIVSLYPHAAVYLKSRLAEMTIECNGIRINPQHLITPELWHDEKAMQIIVADLAKFLY